VIEASAVRRARPLGVAIPAERDLPTRWYERNSCSHIDRANAFTGIAGGGERKARSAVGFFVEENAPNSQCGGSTRVRRLASPGTRIGQNV
jgi:hypothetical protein